MTEHSYGVGLTLAGACVSYVRSSTAVERVWRKLPGSRGANGHSAVKTTQINTNV
jgi:hypothetical protein